MEVTPWMFMDEHWAIDHRGFRCATDGEAGLSWNAHQRNIDDWTAYNMTTDTRERGGMERRRFERFNMSDLRVAASVLADGPGFSTTFQLQARHHVFEFIVRDGQALVRFRDADSVNGWKGPAPVPVSLPAPGRAFTLEFWHVDQALSIYLNGERIVHHEYDWLPEDRLKFATNVFFPERPEDLLRVRPNPAFIQWMFRGTPFTLSRVRMDRDLYYQPVPGFGTSPANPAVLGPDHFFMLGDNSPASRDSRLWGEPDELVARQIDPSPYVVHRTLLLGKAWVVYFPAPHPITEGGVGVIPDFGRLRYIR
jgi:hypothetical protein